MNKKKVIYILITVISVIMCAKWIYNSYFASDNFVQAQGPAQVLHHRPVSPPSNNSQNFDYSDPRVQNRVKDIVRSVRPCVVNITAFDHQVLDNQGKKYSKLLKPFHKGNKVISSGIIIDNQGTILTTKDAVPTNQVEVKLFRRKPNTYQAELLKIDTHHDLALLKISGAPNFSPCNLGDSNGVQVGDLVWAVGSPYGFSQTVTSGIVSSSRRKINIEGNVFKNVIQTDTTINNGNNGGPLINIKGEIIGVNAAIYSASSTFSGIGFAIPINQAKKFMRGFKQ